MDLIEYGINIPYENDTCIQTTIGQLNFFKWAIENGILTYIEENYDSIERDMNSRNSTAKRKEQTVSDKNKTRKKREELSVSAIKSVKKETVEIVVKFDNIKINNINYIILLIRWVWEIHNQ